MNQRGKKVVKTALNLEMIAAAILVGITMKELKVQRLLYCGGPFVQTHVCLNKNSIKSNQTICGHLEENEMTGNYGLRFAISLQSNPILPVNDQ